LAACLPAQAQLGLAGLHVPEGFVVEVAAGPELSAYPMFMEFDPEGRMYIAESSGKDLSGKEMVAEPGCSILMLEDVDHDGVFDKRTVFADKLSLPMGVLWHEGSVYTASPPDFIRLKDTDGDGVADEREVILTGWNVLNTASLHGPFLGQDGYMYLTHGRHGYKIETKEGHTLEGQAARIWRCKPDGTQLERYCGGGFDNPVEIAFTEAGELIGTMTYFTDPMNGQRDALMHWVEGGVYPKVHESLAEFDHQRTGDLLQPITKFARVAPSGFMRYRGQAFGAEFKDSYFSAQFNPHRVQRHIITRAGATFASQDSDFLTSTDPDFHPTDVLEDADGSVLVSDTGAWYVDACPVSRVSKPEIRGTVYRIRRADAPKVEDPRGLKLAWDKATAKQLAERLQDPRTVVRDRAGWALSAMPGKAEAPLKDVLESDAGTVARIAALNALARLNTPDARAAIVAAMKIAEPEIQIAAAHAGGLFYKNRDERVLDEASIYLFEPLCRLVESDYPAVKREAAASLGRYGTGGVQGLMGEFHNRVNDPFLEHALIHAMKVSDGMGMLWNHADAAEPEVRRAMLIVLDGPTHEEAFAPFLSDPDQRVRDTALWIASRHPEWADTVAASVDKNLQEWSSEQATLVGGALRSFASNADIQEIVARLLAEGGAPERQAFLLDTIEQSPLNPLPESWVAALGSVLDGSDPTLQMQAVRVIRTRWVEAYDARLSKLGDDAKASDALRVAALDAAVARAESWDAKRFDYVTSRTGVDYEPAVRQAAARLLSKAPLTAKQAQHVAESLLPEADALTFSSLLAAVGKQADEATGKALVAALGRAKYDVNRIPPREIEALFAAYPASVQEAAAPIRAKAATLDAARVARLQELTPKLGTGDVGRGRQVFFSEKVACGTCHAIGAEGGTLGPDLTTVGAVRSGGDLLEALLFPNASIVQGYESYRVDTLEASLIGVLGRETADGVTVRTAATEETYVPRADITAMEQYPLSLMPEGLDAGITEDELIDLLAFLQSLNKEQWLLPERREVAAHE
jgi:putative membrane-bound dehydrogenase-like protein